MHAISGDAVEKLKAADGEQLRFPHENRWVDKQRIATFPVHQDGDRVRVVHNCRMNKLARSWHQTGGRFTGTYRWGGKSGVVTQVHPNHTPTLYSVLMDAGEHCVFYSTELESTDE